MNALVNKYQRIRWQSIQWHVMKHHQQSIRRSGLLHFEIDSGACRVSTAKVEQSSTPSRLKASATSGSCKSASSLACTRGKTWRFWCTSYCEFMWILELENVEYARKTRPHFEIGGSRRAQRGHACPHEFRPSKSYKMCSYFTAEPLFSWCLSKA